jgi:hypothetical protein
MIEPVRRPEAGKKWFGGGPATFGAIEIKCRGECRHT